MWRGKDVVYNILGYLVFVVPIEMPFIAYREPSSGGVQLPPRNPPRWGGARPPLKPPLRCASTKRTSCLQKFRGGVLWLVDAGGIVVVEMPLWVTSKTMQVDWAIHYRQKLIKKMEIWQKSQWG